MFRWNRRKQKKVEIELDEARNIYDRADEHYQRGELKAALEGYRSALAIEERLDPDSLNIAATYSSIGLVLKYQGDLEGALREYRRALVIQEREAPDSLTVATTYNNIGGVLYSQGDLEGALREFRRALVIREREAPDSLTVATSYNNIGSVLDDQGDLEGALREYRRALTIVERNAPDSLTVATMYNNIGLVLHNQGNLEGALREYRRALVIREREAPDSLTVATSYNNIGLVLKNQGDLDGALQEYQRALVIREREAPDSLTVATSYNNIGSVLKAQGDLDGALQEYRRALVIDEREAPDSLTVATSYNNIGSVLDDKGDLDGALQEYRRALVIVEREAPDSLTVATTYNNIGGVLKAQGDLDGALREFRRALVIEERKAPDSLTVAASYHNIGKVLHDQGDLDGALQDYRRALAIEEREAPDSLTVATTYKNIGLVLKEEGDIESALLEYQRALAIQERKAPNSLEAAKNLISIGSATKDKGDLVRALPYFERSHEILLRPQISLSPLHPTLISCKYELGDLLLKCRNDYERGLQLADEIIEALPEYKWAYTLKARAQLGLGEIQAAVDTYNAVISLAPNYADAHAGRLQAFVDLEEKMNMEIRRKEEERELLLVQMNMEIRRREEERELILVQIKRALDVAKSVDPKAHEEVDEKIQKLFREESRKANLSTAQDLELQVELPKQAIGSQEELRAMLEQIMEQNKQTMEQNKQIMEQNKLLGIRMNTLEASINNIPDFIVEMENVHCPYLFQIITKDEFEAFQKEKEQQMDTLDGVLDALNRAERFWSKTNEILEDYLSGDIAAKARKGALNKAWQSLSGKKQEDFYLQLLCGWTFKPVVSYKIKSTAYSEEAVKFAQLGARMCTVGVKVSILWNMASDTARMFGYPLPTIPEDHVEKARDFLSDVNNSTEVKDLKEKEREGFSLSELDEFGSFLEERKAKMCHMCNIFDKDKLKDKHWSEALKKQATKINGKTNVTYVSTDAASRLESSALLKSQQQRAS